MTKRYSHPTPEHKKRAVNLATVDTSMDTSEKLADHALVPLADVSNHNQ